MRLSAITTLVTLTSLSSAFAGPSQSPFLTGVQSYDADPVAVVGERVNVSLYVMSRCPDARQCENVFEEVLQTKGIVDKINLHVGYIGTLNKSAPLGVTCKHGLDECIGNAHQLCVYNHVSTSSFSHFISAQNYESSFPSEIGKLDFTKRSAKAVGIDWLESGVGKCIEGKHPAANADANAGRKRTKGGKDGVNLGKEARRLLLASIKDTHDAGVTTSCTIDIESTLVAEGKRRCVVDGGVWRGCDDGHTATDFVRVIEAEWKNLQSSTVDVDASGLSA